MASTLGILTCPALDEAPFACTGSFSTPVDGDETLGSTGLPWFGNVGLEVASGESQLR